MKLRGIFCSNLEDAEWDIFWLEDLGWNNTHTLWENDGRYEALLDAVGWLHHCPFQRSGGRLCTRFLGSQVHADGSAPGSQVHADGSGQGRKGNGLVCTCGQGPHLYTAKGLVCTRGMVLLYVHLCSYSCVFCVLHVCRLSSTGL